VRTAVITIVAGREIHLGTQRRGLVGSTVAPDVHVVVVMGGQEVAQVPGLCTEVVHVEVPPSGLPLAAARNAGARRAAELGAELLVLLDVDCIPAPELVSRYVAAARTHPGVLLAGPVAYLPVAPPAGYDLAELAATAAPHPARPVPADGEVVPEPRTELFWSLSFATTACTWARVGGFHPGYTGYGAEDTDFAIVAAAAGVPLAWVGGATAFHQHHGPSGPTAANAPSIVRNAHLFHERHGWWPMSGWLTRLHEDGLVHFDPATGRLDLVPATAPQQPA
jgi:N-acetylglucosaminyl-diphospho-decaprenol L-rhamnosyltransferase